MQRTPDTPRGALGRALPGTMVVDPDTGVECPRAVFDADGFEAFLAGEPDMGTKWAPRYVRISETLPVTATTKVLKRVLRAEGWRSPDPVWWRPDKDAPYRLLTAADADALDRAVAAR